jgi:hypothetical protein
MSSCVRWHLVAVNLVSASALAVAASTVVAGLTTTEVTVAAAPPRVLRVLVPQAPTVVAWPTDASSLLLDVQGRSARLAVGPDGEGFHIAVCTSEWDVTGRCSGSVRDQGHVVPASAGVTLGPSGTAYVRLTRVPGAATSSVLVLPAAGS